MYNLSDADRTWVNAVWDRIDAKMSVVVERNKDKIPYTTDENGYFNDCANGRFPYDISWWTNGFWPGYMWLLYVGTGKKIYKEVAETAEEILDKAFDVPFRFVIRDRHINLQDLSEAVRVRKTHS